VARAPRPPCDSTPRRRGRCQRRSASAPPRQQELNRVGSQPCASRPAGAQVPRQGWSALARAAGGGGAGGRHWGVAAGGWAAGEPLPHAAAIVTNARTRPAGVSRPIPAFSPGRPGSCTLVFVLLLRTFAGCRARLGARIAAA